MKYFIYIAGVLLAGGIAPFHAQALHRADPAVADAAVPATNYSAQLTPRAQVPAASPASNWRALNTLVTSYNAMAPVPANAGPASTPTLPAPSPSLETLPVAPDPHAHHRAGPK